jgi:hypothetical protein
MNQPTSETIHNEDGLRQALLDPVEATDIEPQANLTGDR